jgi:hypothetical protein
MRQQKAKFEMIAAIPQDPCATGWMGIKEIGYSPTLLVESTQNFLTGM